MTHDRTPRLSDADLTLEEKLAAARAPFERLLDVEPDHTEPDGDRQPREHAVLCSRCLKPTFNLSGVCGREHA